MGAVRKEKLRVGTFKHIESELYGYWNSINEMKRLKAEILYSSPYIDEVGGGKSNLPSDPTGKAATLLLSHRRLGQLENIVEAIRTVVEYLPEDKKKLVQLKYWTQPQPLTWEGIAQQIPVSKRTALRWRDEIVYEVADQLGWR